MFNRLGHNVISVSKRRLDRSLTFQSAVFVIASALALVVLSGAIAKACGPPQGQGCDINCTVQTINDCPNPQTQSCVARTCYCIRLDTKKPCFQCTVTSFECMGSTCCVNVVQCQG
jgi:hypothetical protein